MKIIEGKAELLPKKKKPAPIKVPVTAVFPRELPTGYTRKPKSSQRAQQKRRQVSKKARKPIGPYFRKFGKGAGKVIKATGKGVWDVGAGFAEGLGVKEIKVSPRGVGRGAGKAIKGTAEFFSRVQLRPDAIQVGMPGGERYQPSMTTLGTATPSHLPMEVQQAMVQLLSEMYPEIYQSIWEPSIRMSEFIGRLKNVQPVVYEDLKNTIYQSIGHQQYQRYQQRPPWQGV